MIYLTLALYLIGAISTFIYVNLENEPGTKDCYFLDFCLSFAWPLLGVIVILGFIALLISDFKSQGAVK